MAETLETIARALFKSWFVDFDPVHARSEGRSTGLPDDVAALFPHSFGEDGVPNGWSISRLERLIELAYGKSLVAERREAGPVAVYGSNGRVGQHNVALVNGPGIVIGRKGNPGTVTYVDIPLFPIDTTFYVVPRQKTPISYLWLLLQNASLEKLSADSAVPGLNREAAYSAQIVEPDSAIVKVFDEVVSALLARAASARDEAQTLADLRDALLPKLLSGELRVVRPEANVSAA